MKKTLLLLTTTAIFLTSCDDSPDASRRNIHWFDALKAYLTGQVPAQYTFNVSPELIQQVAGQYQRQTVTGNYLAGRFAQAGFDWETASNYFSALLQEDSSNIDLQRRAMVLAMGAGKYDDAMKYAREVVTEGDKGSLPKLFLTIEKFKKGDYDGVLLDTQKIPDDGISDFIKPLLKSWTSAGKKQTDITGLNKNVVHFYHAVLIADFVNDKQALQALARKDYALSGLSITTLKQIADIFEKNGLTAQADALRKNIPAVQLDAKDLSHPKDKIMSPQQGMSRAFFDMASVLYQNYPDSARLFVELSLYLEQDNNDARILQAHMAAQFERYEEAIQILQGIDEKSNPDLQIKINRQIADLLQQSGKMEQAITVLRDIVEKTKDINAQIQIGDIYRESDDFNAALKEYNKAFAMLDGKLSTRYWNLPYARGITHERLKNWKDAEKDLQTALKLQPNHPYILNYLGYSWADQNINLDQATSMIERAVQLRPEDGFIVDSLGWVYYRTGKYTLAVATLEQAIELSPYDPTINDHLGDAYWRTGRKAEARFQWKRALSFKPEPALEKTILQKIESGLPPAGKQ